MKSQMKFQKILSLVSLIFAAVTLVYSFSFNSGMLFEIQAYAVEQYKVEGAKELVDFAKTANNILVIMSIVLLLCVVFIYLTQTNKRRKYYITNYIAIGLLVLFTLACSITFLVIIARTFALCGQVDTVEWLKKVEELTSGARLNPQHYSLSKVSLILGIVVAVLMLVLIAVWVLNTLLKIKLMRGEENLLKNSAPVVTDAEVKEVQ